MSWFKKTRHKITKTLDRAKHGRFHLNPLKNGVHAMTDPVGHSWFKLLPSKLQHKLTRNLSWGHLRKSHKLGLSHLLSPSSGSGPYAVSNASSSGFVYNGRSISEMM